MAFTGGALLLRRQPSPARPPLDIPGVLLVSGAVFCLVYGFSNAAVHSWHTPSSYGFLAAGVLGPLILAALGMGLVIAPSISTGTFGVAPQDAGVASATVTVGQQLGASIGTSLLNTIFAGAVTAYLTANLATARIIGRQALTALALAHGYDTAFCWTAGIFAADAVIGGALLRPGPLAQHATPSPAHAEAPTAPAKADPALPA